MKQVLLAVCLVVLSCSYAAAQSGTDSILTTKGAVTLITCGSAINTFQIGDGKNADYDYRIVDGNVVFIRPIVANPRPTNLVVREGDNIHYLILAFKDKADLAHLKYTLSTGPKGAVPPNNIPSTGNAGGAPILPNQKTPVLEDPAPAAADVDTVTVSKIADDFIKQKHNSHQYETTSQGVTLNFSQAMVLNNLVYYSFRVKNRASKPFEIGKITLIHQQHRDTTSLHTMPVVYRKGGSVIPSRDEESLVYVAPAREFKKDDEIILVMYDKSENNQVVLYTPVSALPKYMITK
jgi:hypothetical protein